MCNTKKCICTQTDKAHRKQQQNEESDDDDAMFDLSMPNNN